MVFPWKRWSTYSLKPWKHQFYIGKITIFEDFDETTFLLLRCVFYQKNLKKNLQNEAETMKKSTQKTTSFLTSIFRILVSVLGRFWKPCWNEKSNVGACLVVLGASWMHLGRLMGALGRFLRTLGRFWLDLGRILLTFWVVWASKMGSWAFEIKRIWEI